MPGNAVENPVASVANVAKAPLDNWGERRIQNVRSNRLYAHSDDAYFKPLTTVPYGERGKKRTMRMISKDISPICRQVMFLRPH